ncbi:MAG: hypothetical protein WAX77_10365 [Methylococcaceae bacterium]
MINHTQSATPPTGRSLASRLLSGGFAALSLMLVLMSSQAQATGTTAGSVIQNTATAKYLDNSGTTQTANSNTVQTTVQAVGSFTLIQDNTKIAAAGTTVYMPHTLTNTGNAPDNFALSLPITAIDSNLSSIQIFADANGDGQPDTTTPMCTVGGSSPCTNVLTGTLQPDTGFSFIVAMSVKSTATDAYAVPAEVVTATPASTSTITYATNTRTNTDNLTVQNQLAIINFTKAVMGAGTNPTSSPVVTSYTNGINSGSSTIGTTGRYVTYRLSYTNSGNATGPVYVSDTIGSGATVGYSYIAGSAKWSNPGVGITSLTDATGVEAGGVGADYTVSTTSGVSTITANLFNVPANSSGYIEFNVQVLSTAALGTTETNNAAQYGTPVGCEATGGVVTACANATTPSTPPTTLITTNYAPFDVTGVYSLVANKDTSTTDGDNATPTGQDLVISAPDKAQAGDTVVFTDYIHNTGNSPDTYNVTLGDYITGLTAFPSGTIFQLYKSDGTTPLTDSNGDSTPDTGPITAGNYYAVVIKAILPSNATAGGPYTESLTATSVADSTQSNLVFNQLTQIVNPSLALVSNSSNQIYPGGTVVYPHTLVNNGNDSCTTTSFAVTNSLSGANWQYTLYVDGNNNGLVDGSDTLIGGGVAGSTILTDGNAPNTAGILVTALGTSTAQKALLVKVTAPSGAVANDQDVIQVTANANCVITGSTNQAVSTTPVIDTTTVVLGELRVQKTQVLDTACGATQPTSGYTAANITTAKPGDCIWYRVVATNQGLAEVINVDLTDQVPSFTKYQGGKACTSTFDPTSGHTAGTVVLSGTTINVFPGQSTTTITTTDTSSSNTTSDVAGTAVTCQSWAVVKPNAAVQLDFAVKIQ